MGGVKGTKKGGGGGKEVAEVPKGCMGIRVGGEGETPERFVVPVGYLNHPLFLKLLKAAEEEFGFDHQGAIMLPCRVDEFQQLRRVIDGEVTTAPSPHRHHHNNFAVAVRCFWV